MSEMLRRVLRGLAVVLLLSSPLAAQVVADEGAGAAATTEDGGADLAGAEAASAADALTANMDLPAGAPDYEAWSRVALRAEEALEAGRASDQALETLRNTIVEWRDRFSSARNENRVPITTLRNQIAALGPAPADGESESATVSTQRAALNAQLEIIERPALAAEIAFARADTIIAEIDNLLRGRQAETLMSVGPSPLNPANWSTAATAVTNTVQAAGREVQASLASPPQRVALRSTLPAVLLLTTISMVLIFGGRHLAVMMGKRVLTSGRGPARGVWSFLISLGEVFLPFIGLLFLVIAVNATGLLGQRAEPIVNSFIGAWINVVAARWIGARVFGREESQWEVLNLTPAGRIEGRIHAVLLGFAAGLMQFVTAVAGSENYPDAVVSVLQLPIVVFTGIVLFRVGRLLRSHVTHAQDETEEGGPGFRDRTLSLGGRAIVLVGIIGPVLCLVGYGALGEFMTFATAQSVAVVGFLLIFHVFFVDLYGTVTKASLEDAQQALIPVIATLLIFVLSMPVFALIWGVRSTELGEIWGRLGQGIALGESVITPSDIILIFVVFALGFGATRLVQGMLKTTVLPKTNLDIGGRNAITSGIGYVGYFLAAVIAVTSVGINLSSLAVVAGALSLGIGFGLQTIVSNFVSGIILLIERPISEGDWIEVGPNMGIVKDISVRATRIETFDRTDVVVPNSDLISGVVTNYTRGNKIGRVIVPVGVAYGTDSRKVESILMEIAQNHPMVTVNPAPMVIFTGFGADSLNFEIRAILSDVLFQVSARSDMNHDIAKRFAEEGIEIPFAQRDIWLRNPEALRPPADPVDENRSKPQADDPSHSALDGEGEGDPE